jgi:hypothetical protein
MIPYVTKFLSKHFLLVLLTLAAILVISWYGVWFGKGIYEFNETFNVPLAEDAQTKEYLGEIINVRRDDRTGEVISYQIRRNDKSIIERTPDSIIVIKP